MKRLVSRLWVPFIVSFLLLIAAVPFNAQQPDSQNQLTVEATSVAVDVIVTDRKGHPVSGLTANDFKVYEEGAEQKVTTFAPPAGTSDQTPASEAALTAATSATTPNDKLQLAQAQKRPDRFLTVVLDLTDNRMTSIQTACETVIRYLKKNKAADTSVAIYYVAGHLRLALPFTSDMQKAEATLQDLSRHTPTGAMAGGDRRSVQQEINELYSKAHPESRLGAAAQETVPQTTTRGASPMEPYTKMYEREIDTMQAYMQMQNSYHARDIFVALRALAFSYRDIPGRKNVVLFSEGFSFDRDSRAELDSVIEIANRMNVSFYIFDPSGLGVENTMDKRQADNKVAQMNSIAAESVNDQQGGMSKFDKMQALLTENDLHQELGELANSTGGQIYYNNNDLTPAFARVVEDTRNFYTLVYHPQNKDWDGKFRKLKVTIPGHEGLLVRHRLGYWAIPRSEGFAMTPTQAHLLSSAQQGAIKSDVKSLLQADIVPAADSHWYAPFSVSVPLNAITLPKDGSKGDLVLVAFSSDENGKMLSTYERRLDFTRGSTASADNGVVTLHGQLALPGPGPTRVQTILQLGSGKFAISQQDVKTSLTNAPLLSSLVVTDKLEQSTCDDPSEALCLKNLRLKQSVPLAFPSSSKLVAYLSGTRLSPDPNSKVPKVGVQFVVRSADKVVATIPLESVQALPGAQPDAVMFIAEVPLQSLAKGNYTLEATAFDLVRHTSSKQTRAFEVQ